MPGARCTRGLACKIVQQTHTSIQVQRRHSDIPCAMVLQVIRALPGVPGFLATVACEFAACRARRADIATPTDLTPASGGQDHTISPSASAPLASRHQRVHRIPLPTFVTMAKRPSDGDGMREDKHIFLKNGSEIFGLK